MSSKNPKAKKKTLGEKVQDLDTMLQNNQIAMRLMQNLLLKVNNGLTQMDTDVGGLIGHVKALEYRTLAMVEQGVFDKPTLDATADALKLKDFNEASDEEDVKNGYLTVDQTDENSIVIFTSTVEGKEDAGIFRSKFPIKDMPFPELKEKLIGVKVGDIVDLQMKDELHHVEILGIRQPEIKEELPVAEPVEE